MSEKSSTFSTLLKIGGAALALHIAYKMGKKVGVKEGRSTLPPPHYRPPFDDFSLRLPETKTKVRQPKTYYPEYDFVYEEPEIVEEVSELQEEVNYVEKLIHELKTKKDKSQKDKYNIDLLQIKLKQLKQKL
jgi:hypothetical protein